MAYEIIMPVLGMSQDTGVIANWCKSPGEYVNAGDVIMEVETDKAVQEIEASQSGYLSKILYKASEEVPVGEVVGVISEELPDDFDADKAVESGAQQSADDKQPATRQAQASDQDADTNDSQDEDQAERPAASSSDANVDAKSDKDSTTVTASGTVLASAKARLIAHENSISLEDVAAKMNKSPLHSQDVNDYLDMLARGAATSTSQNAIGAAPAMSKFACRVPKSGIAHCEDWLAAQQGDNEALTSGHLIATLVSGLWRQHVVEHDASIRASVQCANQDGFTDSFLIDADLQRFSKLSLTQQDETASIDFSLIDLRASKLCEYSPAAFSHPVIIISKAKKRIKISLYGMPADKNIAALRLMDQLARQLEEPLLHIV